MTKLIHNLTNSPNLVERIKGIDRDIDTLNAKVGSIPEGMDIGQSIIDLQDNKQDKLTAGEGISIENNVISNTQRPAEWGNITGDITNQVDLQNELSSISDSIPTKTSDLTNDSGFITNSVNDLVNYYLKSETYTQAEVNNLIGSIQSFHYEIYPTIGSITTPLSNVLYLIGPSGTGSDRYEEYVYSNNNFVKIGETSIDLSGYVTIDNLNNALSNYTTTANLTTLLAQKQDVLTAGAGISVINNVISNTIPGATISNTAPSDPTQGMLRYDTVNDVLKSYDGNNWNEVGNESSDINTKAFYLSGTSDLTNAQAAYDWFSAGKNPIVMYNNRAYLLYAKNATQLIFQDIENSAHDQDSYTEYVGQKVIFTLSGNDVTAINYNSTSGWSGPILRTDVDYPTPYTPTYAGSPTTKQYVDNNDTYIGASAPTGNVVEGRLWYDTTNNVLKVYDGTNWNAVGTDTIYTAGTGIAILNGVDYSALQGPCPTGFHVPTLGEVNKTKTIMNSLGLDTFNGWVNNFFIPMAGFRYPRYGANQTMIGDGENRWTSTCQSGGRPYSVRVLGQSTLTIQIDYSYNASFGACVRPFYNGYVEPTASWTVLNGTLGGPGIFHNATDGIISLNDGTNYITMADKNLGATTVYNSGDTRSQTNCGNTYQWGNNYGFSYSSTVQTSNTKVDASSYGPGNYYSSSTFIQTTASEDDWSNPSNTNLWGGDVGIVTINNVITNTGVTSVNGQTGNVTIQTGGNYTAGNGINISQNNEISVDTSVVATQTDLTLKQDTLTAGNGISIDSNNIITNTLPGAVVSTTAPANPSKGTSWYDTTNDILKVYNGSSWVEVGNGKQSFFKTQAEYDTLPASKESDGNLYIIVDSHLMPFAELTQLTPEPGAILSELNKGPKAHAEYYYENGDIEMQETPSSALPRADAYLKSYGTSSDTYTYIFVDTNLTEQEITDIFTSKLPQKAIDSLINGEWFIIPPKK